MANYDGGQGNAGYPSKPGLGALLPGGQVDSGFARMEPLLTPKELVNRHLKGIPLVSKMKNPVTNKYDVWTPEDLESEIKRAITNIENELGIDIMPIQHAEKQEFNRFDYSAFGYMKTRHKPVQSIEQFSIVPANNEQVYIIPLDWIETAYAEWGQFAIVPLNVAVQNGGFIPAQSAGGAVFLSILAQNSWIPAYWRVTYTTGWPNGILPVVVNELIGVVAAYQVLSKLLATWIVVTSHSLGMDGMSQSVGTPQIALFKDRIDELKEEKAVIGKKLRRMFGQGISTTAF
jgi:hypothetical protein